MNTKAKRTPPKMEDMTKEQLREYLMKKRECDAKAQSIVIELLDSNVTEKMFIESLPHLTRNHYEDVTIERSIIKHCGYPLCRQQLKDKVPAQTYKICMKNNTVYDITERKNFCSNQCYKASTFIKEQILTSPLWFRKKEDIPKFQLLSLNSKGAPGEIIDISITEKIPIDKDSHFTSLLDFTEASLSEMELSEENNDPLKKSFNSSGQDVQSDHNKSTIKTQEDKKDTPQMNENVDKKDDTIANPERTNAAKSDKRTIKTSKTNIKKKSKTTPMIIGDVIERKSENREDPFISAGKDLKLAKMDEKSSKSKEKHISDNTPTITLVEKCISEWFSLDTLLFLFGEKKVKEMVADKSDSIKEYLHNLTCGPSSSSVSYDAYTKLCRKLNILELEDIKYDAEVNQMKKLKPLPDYSILKEEGKQLDIKVRAYYKGDMTIPEREHVMPESPEIEDDKFTNLPLIHKSAQHALRRKIVLNGLDKVLPDLLRALNVAPMEVISDVQELIVTFNLQAHNITFKAIQWNLIALVIIRLLSVKESKLHAQLNLPIANNHLKLMLLSYELDQGYLDRLIWWLTDIDRLLEVHPVEILK